MVRPFWCRQSYGVPRRKWTNEVIIDNEMAKQRYLPTGVIFFLLKKRYLSEVKSRGRWRVESENNAVLSVSIAGIWRCLCLSEMTLSSSPGDCFPNNSFRSFIPFYLRLQKAFWRPKSDHQGKAARRLKNLENLRDLMKKEKAIWRWTSWHDQVANSECLIKTTYDFQGSRRL